MVNDSLIRQVKNKISQEVDVITNVKNTPAPLEKDVTVKLHKSHIDLIVLKIPSQAP